MKTISTSWQLPGKRANSIVFGTMLALLPALGWAQTTIASQNFEAVAAVPNAPVTTAGGGPLSGNGAFPAAPRYVSGTQGFGVSSGTATITSNAGALDVSGYTGVSVSLRLASFSANGTNGADGGDLVTLAISTDGTTFNDQLRVAGNSNSRWSFSSGTGTAARAYATTAVSVSTSTGGDATTAGYSTLTVSNIPPTTTLRFRVTLLNDNASETWAIDDIVVKGTPTGPVLNEVVVPQYAAGHASGSAAFTDRLPYAFRATLSGLSASATYRYYTQAIRVGDAATVANAQGGSIFANLSGAFGQAGTPDLSSSYGTFTTSAGGSFTGWFGLEANNAAVFDVGSLIRPVVVINDGSGGSAATAVLPTASSVSVLEYGAAAGQASALYGQSAAPAQSVVLTFDVTNPGAATRPLYASFVEDDGAASTSSYAAFYRSSVDGQAGRWGSLMPNTNANGIRYLGQYALSTGALVCANTDADGSWPGGANTASPSAGLSALALTATDAPLAAPGVPTFSPGSGVVGDVITITGSNFVAGGSTVSFGGTAATVVTVNSASSLTAAVPAGASSGTIRVNTSSSCGTTPVPSAASFTVITPNPAPGISSLSPSAAVVGGGAFTLTVTGSGFVSSTTTTFSLGGSSYGPNAAGFSATSFTVSIPAAAIASIGAKAVVVSNPPLGGGTAASTFTVNPPPCLSEGFEGVVPPTGWLSVNAVAGSAANTGSGAAELNAGNGSLTMPELSFPSSLTFALGRTNNASAKTLEVQVSTTSASAGFSTVATYTHANTTSNAYTPLTVDLAAYSGEPSVWIQFVKTSATTSPWRLDDVAVTCLPSGPTISTDAVSGAPFCVASAGAAVTVPFTVSNGPFDAGNTFTAYISNDNFVANKTALTTAQAGTGSGSLSGTIPVSVLSGSSYRIRVEASSPPSKGTRNSLNLTCTNYNTNEVTSFFAVGGNAEVTLSWVLPTACVSRVVVIARAGAAVTVKPTGVFSASSIFGSGTDLGTMLNPNQYVVYDGPATGLSVTGLTNLTNYHFAAFASNGGADFSDGTQNSATPVVPATLTEVYLPQLISGHAVGSGTHSTRLPYAFRVSIGNLQPSTTYKYYNSAVDANAGSPDGPTYGGVGSPIYPVAAGAFVRQASPAMSSGGSFTTDAAGEYHGWFGLDPTGNDRFEDGDLLRMRIIINAGNGGNTELYFLTTSSTVAVRQLGSGAAQATAVRGSSFGSASNFILTYDNTAGTGRPLAATWVESDGSAASSYAAFYSSVDGTAGAWGLLTPNTNAAGMRRVEQRSLADASLVGCEATDADGSWPGGAATANPSGGSTALVLSTGDAPFLPATAGTISPVSAVVGATITITGTRFTTSPRPTVRFNGGTPVTAATVNGAGSSLTVVVPAGAGSGPITITAGCGSDATTVGSFTVTPTSFYTKAIGDVDVLGTYGDQLDGSGSAPGSFTAAGQTFTITGTGRSCAASFTVSGSSSALVLGNDASLVVPATVALNATIDMAAGSSLSLLSSNVSGVSYRNLAPGSTVVYDQAAGVFTVPTAPTYANLKLSNGSKRLGDLSVSGDLTLENTVVSGAVLNTATNTASDYATVQLAGNFTQLGGVSYDQTRNITLELTNPSTEQTLAGNGYTIELYRLLTDSGSPAVGGRLSGAGSVLLLANSIDGGLALYESTASLALDAGTTLRFKPGGGGNIFVGTTGLLKPDPAANLEFYRNTINSYTLGTLRLAPGFTSINNLVLSSTANGANTLTLTSDLTVNGTATLQAGTLVIDSNTLTLNGTLAVATGGFLHGSSSSNLSIGGSGAFGTLSFASGARQLNNLTMARSGGSLTLGAPLAVGGTLALTNGIVTTAAGSLLTLGTVASISGGSASSYISGPLARSTSAGTRTVFFPVGKGSSYRPLTLNTLTQTSNTTYTSEQIEGPPTQTMAGGSGLARVSFQRLFRVTPDVQPSGYTGTVTLSFGVNDYVNDPANAALVIAKRSDSSQPWTNLDRSAYTGAANGGQYVSGSLTSSTSTPITSFSEFALAATNVNTNFFTPLNPLPVELSSFSAQRQPQGVQLRWTTATELNNARFEVQRSADGKAFALIATAEGHGSSSQAVSYGLLDQEAPLSRLYYRLRQVDQDGSARFSPVVMVAGGLASDVAVFPNPARSAISFATAAATPYYLLNQLGQTLQRGTTTAGMATVSVAALPPGVYYLLLNTEANSVVRRFVKE
jgi:hypothetical protein